MSNPRLPEPPPRTGLPQWERILCRNCRHLAITYDPQLPYLCRNMGIKTRHLPCQEVLRASGQVCLGYAPKAAREGAA
jgi:hypothetical protein